MSSHVEELLPDFVLGLLGPSERVTVDDHLAGCATCREAASALSDAADTVAVEFGPANGRSRLDAALAGARRFEHLFDQVAAHFDISREAAQALLEKVDDDSQWSEGPAPGVRLMAVEAGPARAGLISALLSLDPGATFPDHAHGAEERVLVLEGGYRCSTGVEMWRGELDVSAPGTNHSSVRL